MFRWLTDATYDVIAWADSTLSVIEHIHNLSYEENAFQQMRDIISDFENQEYDEDTWGQVCSLFPDLIDELNDLKLTLFNTEHPDDE